MINKSTNRIMMFTTSKLTSNDIVHMCSVAGQYNGNSCSSNSNRSAFGVQ